MAATTHLKALQALEMSIRLGSLKAAAERLAITPAAVGQRIRALEEYLGADLLLRGRSGMQPTAELKIALDDLRTAFAALDRAVEALDFQRVAEIQVVADPDWAELWLHPRLPGFRELYPGVRFCINGEGDVPVRLGAPDVRVVYGEEPGEPLFTDVLIPISGPDNRRRLLGTEVGAEFEGMALLHLKRQLEEADHPGWVDWFAKFGRRQSGRDRGVRYQHSRVALEAVRQEVGYLVCGLSLIGDDLEQGRIFNLAPMSQHLVAPHPYRLLVRQDADRRPQVQRFVSWLREQARDTERKIARMTGEAD